MTLFRTYRLRRLYAQRDAAIARYSAACRAHAPREHLRRAMVALTARCMALEAR